MNVGQLFRDSWRITWKNWPLWALNLLMFLVAIPVFALSAAFGGAAALVSTPLPAELRLSFVASLQGLPGPVWFLAVLAALILLVVTSAVTWMLQAAAMRGADLAAAHGTVKFGEAIRLGRQRVISIAKLSLTFGLAIAAIGLLPPLALLLLKDFAFGAALVNLAQTGLIPFNVALSLAVLLVMMAIALEDLAPRAALRRAWQVFRSGWWGFMLIFGLSALPAIVLTVLVVVPMAIVIPVVAFNPEAGLWLMAGTCAIVGPLGLGVILFVAVFTVVLYTLTFRAAAAQAGQ